MDKKEYKAVIYLRLSKEDGDKVESDSISNQRRLIEEALKSHHDIEIVSERVDDGYSGANFDRPQFQSMMEDIKSGAINCVVVKDLSRFGRNLEEVGRYIERTFPILNVRFIAVNENFDSFISTSLSDKINIPFRNLMNESYCIDTSKKVRTQLAVKRKNGDCISPFAVYGYLKDPGNRNRLIIDEFASQVVRDIFKWKLEGMSAKGIADKLNDNGILSPAEYKKSIGLNYKTAFKNKVKAEWSPNAIIRILKNDMYIGVTTQGKRGRHNHRIKEVYKKPESEWVSVENTHEAIISSDEFKLVSDLLLNDTRIAPSKSRVYPFSGMVFCGSCDDSMIRKTVPVGGKKYFYFACKKHRISEKLLYDTILQALNNHIENIIAIDNVLKSIDNLPFKQFNISKLQTQIDKIQVELDKYQKRLTKLHEHFADDIITKNEYTSLKKTYSDLLSKSEVSLKNLKQEQKELAENSNSNNLKADIFRKNRNITELTRLDIVTLIEKIIVFDNKHIEIKFRYMDEFNKAVKFVSQSSRLAV